MSLAATLPSLPPLLLHGPVLLPSPRPLLSLRLAAPFPSHLGVSHLLARRRVGLRAILPPRQLLQQLDCIGVRRLFLARKLKPAEINDDTRENEFLVLVDACSYWRHSLP